MISKTFTKFPIALTIHSRLYSVPKYNGKYENDPNQKRLWLNVFDMGDAFLKKMC